MAGFAIIERLRELHERAKAGTLSPGDRAEYAQSRRELGRLLLVAQHLGHGGATLRSALRIAQILKVEIEIGGPTPERTTTIDIAQGGFAALLPASHPIGRAVRFTLFLPNVGGSSGTTPMRGQAKVASARPRGGLFRVSFTFEKLDEVAQEQLDGVIIDAVLARFDGLPR
jgi:hypothetical protein